METRNLWRPISQKSGFILVTITKLFPQTSGGGEPVEICLGSIQISVQYFS